jgi:DnaJ-class molecular chaperone
VGLATDQERGVKTCPWCNGSRRCSKCDGTGERAVRTRILRLRRVVDCPSCAGTGVCQLCKRADKGP